MYSLSKDISAAHLIDFSRITHCKESAIEIYERGNIKDGFKDQSKLKKYVPWQPSLGNIHRNLTVAFVV